MAADNIVIPIHVISTMKILYLLESVAVFLVLLYTNMNTILNGIINNAFYILIYSLLFVITILFMDLLYKFDRLIDKIIEQEREKKEREKKEKEEKEKEEKEKEEKVVEDGVYDEVITEPRPSTPVMTLDADLTPSATPTEISVSTSPFVAFNASDRFKL